MFLTSVMKFQSTQYKERLLCSKLVSLNFYVTFLISSYMGALLHLLLLTVSTGKEADFCNEFIVIYLCVLFAAQLHVDNIYYSNVKFFI